MGKNATLTGVEKFFGNDELIVSKTNLKGHLTYCNEIFLSISGYLEKECLGQPHSMIRHPDMPRAVFAMLWSQIQEGEEIFAYVINRCKNGDHYWVNAHVTPSFNAQGDLLGYHSSRRVPDARIISDHIQPLYNKLLSTEQSHSNRKDGMNASVEQLNTILAEQKLAYSEFIEKLAA